MSETRPRQDSNRDLLEELEDGWATPPAPGMKPKAQDAEIAKAAAAEIDALSDDKIAVLEAAAARVEAESARMIAADKSDPNLSELDEGWLDDLFPEDEDSKEEEEEAEEPEPELPDERVDPVAFAEAKKARDERAALKKDKKRAKLEAKRTRQRAKLAAVKQKQKAKKARAGGGGGPTSQRSPVASKKKQAQLEKKEKKAAARAAAKPTDDVDTSASPSETDIEELEAAGVPVAKKKAPMTKKKAPPSTMASIRLLAIVLGVLLALAALVAAILK